MRDAHCHHVLDEPGRGREHALASPRRARGPAPGRRRRLVPLERDLPFAKESEDRRRHEPLPLLRAHVHDGAVEPPAGHEAARGAEVAEFHGDREPSLLSRNVEIAVDESESLPERDPAGPHGEPSRPELDELLADRAQRSRGIGRRVRLPQPEHRGEHVSAGRRRRTRTRRLRRPRRRNRDAAVAHAELHVVARRPFGRYRQPALEVQARPPDQPRAREGGERTLIEARHEGPEAL